MVGMTCAIWEWAALNKLLSDIGRQETYHKESHTSLQLKRGVGPRLLSVQYIVLRSLSVRHPSTAISRSTDDGEKVSKVWLWSSQRNLY